MQQPTLPDHVVCLDTTKPRHSGSASQIVEASMTSYADRVHPDPDSDKRHL